ncbi:MAG: NAD(P)H-hydrate dehydratase, partial [Nanoarchaeota archaeon]
MGYLTKKDILLPKRNSNSKKGDNGRVLVIGGSKDYVGAVVLAGLSALRSGCDWVTVITPEKVAFAINSLSL